MHLALAGHLLREGVAVGAKGLADLNASRERNSKSGWEEEYYEVKSSTGAERRKEQGGAGGREIPLPSPS